MLDAAETPPISRVRLRSGEECPALGMGTWRLGESDRWRSRDIAAVRHALEIGYRLIDTAEMYAEGGAERVVGEALESALRGGLRRDEVFVVSKVYPHNASIDGSRAACERSLARLRLDRIDLYLLHWRAGVPLAETVEGFEALRARGLIRHWGVSNFDVDDVLELEALAGGSACQANQVYYSASQRGIEFDLLPLQARLGMPAMAYSPIDQGDLAAADSWRELGQRLGIRPAQLALAWAIRSGRVAAIPKAARHEHLEENLAAAALHLTDEVLAEIDRMFPPPRHKRPLAMT